MGVDIGWVRPVGVTGDAHCDVISLNLGNKTDLTCLLNSYALI